MSTTAAIATTFAVVSALGLAFGWPPSVPLFGAVIAMSWSTTVNDPTPRERVGTTLLLWLPTALTAALGALARPDPLASDAVFLALVFVAFFIRTYGPRWVAIGFLAVFSFFLTWFLQADVANVPALLIALAVTTAATYVFRFVLFRDRPERALRAGLRAFRARIRLIATTVIAAQSHGSWTPALRRRLEDHLLRLNYTALLLDDIVRDANENVRAAIFQSEIAVESLAETALVDPRSPGLPEALRDAADEVRALMARARSTGQAHEQWAPRGAFRPRVDAGGVSVYIRQAVQVTVAAGAAIVVGETLSASRWYWAVLAAFVVFAGTSSAGETLNKALGRTGGTVVGIVAGIVVERLVQGNAPLELGLMFAFLFAAVYVFRIWYVGMVFFITAVLSLMYGLLGLFSDQLMVLRLIETGAGALAGALAAAFVLPLRTDRVFGSMTLESLVRLRAVVDVAVDHALGASDADPTTAMRAFDETLQTVRIQLRSTAGPRIAGDPLRRARLLAMAACGFYARNLTGAAMSETPPRSADALRALRAGLDAHLDVMIDALGRRAVPPEGPRIGRPDGDDAAAIALYRIGRALRHLARVIALEEGARAR